MTSIWSEKPQPGQPQLVVTMTMPDGKENIIRRNYWYQRNPWSRALVYWASRAKCWGTINLYGSSDGEFGKLQDEKLAEDIRGFLNPFYMRGKPVDSENLIYRVIPCTTVSTFELEIAAIKAKIERFLAAVHADREEHDVMINVQGIHLYTKTPAPEEGPGAMWHDEIGWLWSNDHPRRIGEVEAYQALDELMKAVGK